MKHLRNLGAHPGIRDGTEQVALTDGFDLMYRLGLITIDGDEKVEPHVDERDMLQYHANSIIQLSASLEAK